MSYLHILHCTVWLKSWYPGYNDCCGIYCVHVSMWGGTGMCWLLISRVGCTRTSHWSTSLLTGDNDRREGMVWSCVRLGKDSLPQSGLLLKQAPQGNKLPEFKKCLDNAFRHKVWILGGGLCGARSWTWFLWTPSNSGHLVWLYEFLQAAIQVSRTQPCLGVTPRACWADGHVLHTLYHC